MRISTLLVSILVLVTTAGCSTVQTAPERGSASIPTSRILPVPGGRGNAENAGVLLAYEFSSGKEGAGSPTCRLRLINQDTNTSYFLPMKTGSLASFVAVAPGHYNLGKIGCGFARVYEMDDVYPGGFEVHAGSASYLGKLIFTFEGSSLSEIRKASRSDSAAAFALASDTVPTGMQVISAFTAHPLTNEMASMAAESPGFDVNAKGLETPKLYGLINGLKTCEKESSRGDTLKFGKLRYTAAYKNGVFQSFKERLDSNAFTAELRDCVAETLSAFRPDAKSAVEIRVVY